MQQTVPMALCLVGTELGDYDYAEVARAMNAFYADEFDVAGCGGA